MPFTMTCRCCGETFCTLEAPDSDMIPCELCGRPICGEEPMEDAEFCAGELGFGTSKDQKNKIGLVVYGVPFYGKDHRVIRACATPELAQKFIDWVRKSPQAYSAEASGWRVQEHTLFESEEDFEYSNCNCVVDYSTKNSNPPGRFEEDLARFEARCAAEKRL